MLVTERRSSGLIVARDSMDENTAGRALKQLDPRFVLQKHPRDDAPDGWVYKVICLVNDRHAPVVFTWVDEHGQALPLSSGLVETLKGQLVGARNKPIGEDEFNRRLVEERARDADNDRQAIREDHAPQFERGRVSVSMGTGKPRYWRRDGARPKSAGGSR